MIWAGGVQRMRAIYSARRTRTLGRTSRATAIRRTILIVGLRTPRSTPEM